jgi:dTDP-4-amino-4,6-dideoxy-D-galactose acyltransferase
MIRILEWESKFFQRKIAHLDISDGIPDSDGFNQYVAERGIELVQTCCDIGSTDTIGRLEQLDFRFVDMRCTFTLDLSNQLANNLGETLAVEADIPRLKELASTLFLDSRYFHSFFELDLSKKFFETWIEKSVHGTFDDFCLKVDEKTMPVGFVSARVTENQTARIGLIGVDPNYSSRGFGTHLLTMLTSYLKSKGISRVEVCTQGKNIKAQNLYTKNHFRLQCVGAWFYKISKRA